MHFWIFKMTDPMKNVFLFGFTLSKVFYYNSRIYKKKNEKNIQDSRYSL